MVGNLLFISFSKAFVICVVYAEMPMGLCMFLRAYSALTLSFDLHKIKPIVGLSSGSLI